MPARHYELDYSINDGATWTPAVMDETPGPGKTLPITGLTPATYSMKLRMVPLSGDLTPIVSNAVILNLGTAPIFEPVQSSADAVVTVADLCVRQEQLIVAVNPLVTAAELQIARDSLLAAISASATVADTYTQANQDNLTVALTAVATVADVQAMLASVLAAATSAATVTDTFTAGADTTAPTVTAFTITSLAPGSLTAAISAASANETSTFFVTERVASETPLAPNAGLTNISTTTSDATHAKSSMSAWVTSAALIASGYIAAGAETVELYLWAKDAAGNVSTGVSGGSVTFTSGLKTVSDPFTGTTGNLISVAQPLWVTLDFSGLANIPKVSFNALDSGYIGGAIWNDTFANKQYAQLDFVSGFGVSLLLRCGSGGGYRFDIRTNADLFEDGSYFADVVDNIYNYPSGGGSPTSVAPPNPVGTIAVATKCRVKVDANYTFTIEFYQGGSWVTRWTGFSAGSNHASGSVGIVVFSAASGDNFSGGEW